MKRVVCFDSWDCGITEKCALGAIKLLGTSSGSEPASQRKASYINVEIDINICLTLAVFVTRRSLSYSEYTHGMSTEHRSPVSRSERTCYMFVDPHCKQGHTNTLLLKELRCCRGNGSKHPAVKKRDSKRFPGSSDGVVVLWTAAEVAFYR